VDFEMKKNETAYAICLVIIVLYLTGCAGIDGKIKDAGKGKPCRFLLYDQYTDYLGRKDMSLKDAFVFSVQTEEKIVSITFDDGPSGSSEKILSTLKRLDCPAAFFLIAGNIGPDNIEQYRDPLFETYIHGYSHDNFSTYDREKCFAEVRKARIAFETLGIKSKYFRPPYGAINNDLKDALKENNLTGILWSLDSLDWAKLVGGTLLDRILSNIQNGDIILFHETPWTAIELENIIAGIRDKGFTIVPLNYLLKFPKCLSPHDRLRLSPVN
jgi:peptidoglycan/xylan/chitin deacetylase (PgdA/CDA1 family)